MAFDTREYEWADVTVVIGGIDSKGIRQVKYKKKVESEPIYAKGREPHSIQTGNSSYEGELELLQSDYDALELAAGGDITRSNIGILVAYGNPANGDAIRTDLIRGVKFTETERAAKQGDKFMPRTLPFIALGIQRIV
ncbi:MAG: hypothetical protein JST78_09560 [Bacteroidetes bacterium]|nr:hypothetical protein [Bacteroidota bacterium]